MSRGTRRDFLRAVSATAVVLVAPGSSRAAGNLLSRVRGWVTSKDRRFEPIEAPQWRTASDNSSSGIHLDPAHRCQDVLGFGGAFTDASCYLFSKLNPSERLALLSELFGS